MSDEVTATGQKPLLNWPGLRNETSPTADAVAPSVVARRPVPEELQFVLESRLVTERPPETSDGSAPDGLSPSRYEHGLWRAGWTDGRLGQTPDPQLQLVASQGALTRSLRSAEASRKLADATAAEQHQRYISEQYRKRWNDISAEYDRLIADRRENSVAYSKGMAWVYLLFGILIFVADMPLSFKVAPTLGVSLRANINNEPVSTSNLGDLFANIGAFWEPVAVAVGIAALTIAFKIVIDKIHRPFGHETRWSRLISSMFMFGFIAAAVGAFVLIARARADYDAGTETDNTMLFTVLAIMFPLVSGYCFSMARAAWQNTAHFQHVTREHAVVWQQSVGANEAIERASAAVVATQKELDLIEHDTVEGDFLKNIYLHGYQRGRCVPETADQQASLFDRCEQLVHYWLAQLPQINHEAAERRT